MGDLIVNGWAVLGLVAVLLLGGALLAGLFFRGDF